MEVCFDGFRRDAAKTFNQVNGALRRLRKWNGLSMDQQSELEDLNDQVGQLRQSIAFLLMLQGDETDIQPLDPDELLTQVPEYNPDPDRISRF